MKALITILLILSVSLGMNAQSIKKIKITDLEKTIADSKTPLIVNFWATFCKPCIEEIPYFEAAVKKYNADSVKLLLVSLDLTEDYPTKVETFAKKRKFASTVQWLDEYNADYFIPKIDSNWSGAIPASLFVNNKTGYRQFFEEQLSREKVERVISEMVKPQ